MGNTTSNIHINKRNIKETLPSIRDLGFIGGDTIIAIVCGDGTLLLDRDGVLAILDSAALACRYFGIEADYTIRDANNAELTADYHSFDNQAINDKEDLRNLSITGGEDSE